MSLRGVALAFLSLLAGSVPAAWAEIPVVELDGVVHAVSASHVIAGIERAEAVAAPLVVIRMDTPGGLDTAMRQIVDKVLNSTVPVAVFVGPSGARAASAGFVIAIAADIVAMAPGTNLGAAHPVAMGGQMDETMSKKVASDAAAYVRGKASRRGRNPEVAEKAVLDSRSFTEGEALDEKLIELVVPDLPALIAALDGRELERFDGSKVTLKLAGQPLVPFEMNWRRAVLSTLARPEVLFLLLLGTLAGLGTEISHPGLLFPGIVGVLCLILFLFASQIIPVNWAGVLLVVLAIALFAAEVKVTSYGLLTIAGLLAMTLGAMMLVDAPVPEMRVPMMAVAPAVLAIAAWTMLLVRLVIQAQRSRSVTGEQGLLGRRGVATTAVEQTGWVRVDGELWRASSEAPLAPGDAVEVTAVDGLTLRVRGGV